MTSDNRYIALLRFMLLALVVAVAPMMVARFILHNHAITVGQKEMTASANRYVMRAEQMFGNAVEYLRNLEHLGITSCSIEHRQEFRKYVRANNYISEIGLVDANGNAMCTEPFKLKAVQILPVAKAEGPRIAMGLMDDEVPGVRAAVVSWRLKDGKRLLAQLTSSAVAIEAGPDYLIRVRRVELGLNNGQIWLASGRLWSEVSGGEKIIRERAASSRFPIEVVISIPESALIELVADLELITVTATAFFGLIFVLLAIWVVWKPRESDDFVRAIKRNQFVPYYQPVMDIKTGAMRGCEVLVRWHTSDGKVISPGSFMPYAEASGHIFEITRQLMGKVVEEVGELHAQAPDLKLSINLFAGHFEDRQIIDDLVEIFEDSPISFEQLVLEVTERQPLNDIDVARKIITEMRAMGMKVALDDAGTGHGGLAYLQDLGIDIIKIDKMFVDRLGKDDNSNAIVDTLIELAGNLGMGIIAEGVENQDQVDRLRLMGVTSAQGYIFAPAMTGEMYMEFARSISRGTKSAVVDSDGSDLLHVNAGPQFGEDPVDPLVDAA